MITSPQNVLNRSRSPWTIRYRRSSDMYLSLPASQTYQPQSDWSVTTVA